jgi:hypothetical protein
VKDEAHIRDSGCASSSLDSQRVQRDKWCCKRGLNSRPLPYQGSALPLSYCSISKCGAKRRSASCHSKAGVARRPRARAQGLAAVRAGCRLKGAATGGRIRQNVWTTKNRGGLRASGTIHLRDSEFVLRFPLDECATPRRAPARQRGEQCD